MIPTIVIIEDDKNLIEYVTELLKSKMDVDVKNFTNGSEAIKHLKAEKTDLIILDLYLGDIHGKTVCEEIRKVNSEVPIIILTGEKSEESVIACLNAGADDYITKPFNSDEFIARINAKFRNLNSENRTTISCKDLTLNTETLEVFAGDKKIDLTSKEYQLLYYLLVNKSRVCLRDKILYAVWGYVSEVDTRVVDVHIGKLRKKLEKNSKRYIKSVRGFGYRMEEEN